MIEKINGTFTKYTILEIKENGFADFTEFENHMASLSRQFSVIHVVNKGERFYKDTWPVFYKGLNYHREKIAGENPVVIILWMRPEDVKDFALTAPDMWHWRSGVFDFELPVDQFWSLENADEIKKKRARSDEIISYLKGNPDIAEALKASLYQELGELYYALGDYKNAEKNILAALDYFIKRGEAARQEPLYKLLESIERVSVTDTKTTEKVGRRYSIAHKILVVDNDPDMYHLIMQIFRKQIRNDEWKFFFAKNGREALIELNSIPGIEVILLDINIPDMGGLTFLDNLNKTGNLTIKSIVVTAFGDMGNIRAAMRRGAFDFIIIPIDSEDLENSIARAIEQNFIFKEILATRDLLISMNSELSIAAYIQQDMLPNKFPPFPHRKEFDLYAKMIPAKRVGGDFYDFFFLDEERLAFAVGDASGKGIPAALSMVKALTLLRVNALKLIHPGECLRALNNEFFAGRGENVSGHESLTLFYGVLNIKTGVVSYSCAGHPSPIVMRNKGEIKPILAVTGMPLGFFENVDYEVEKIQLEKGDIIFAFTDGLTDAENSAGDQFALDGLKLIRYLEGRNNLSLKEIIEGLLAEIKVFAAGAPQADDIAMLALRFN